jgi:hypothetical protein
VEKPKSLPHTEIQTPKSPTCRKPLYRLRYPGRLEVVKVKFTLNQATKAQRGSRGIRPHFLNLGARWGWVVNATPRPFYPWQRPGTQCIGGWLRPRAGLDWCGKSRPHRDFFSVESCHTDCAIPAHGLQVVTM